MYEIQLEIHLFLGGQPDRGLIYFPFVEAVWRSNPSLDNTFSTSLAPNNTGKLITGGK